MANLRLVLNHKINRSVFLLFAAGERTRLTFTRHWRRSPGLLQFHTNTGNTMFCTYSTQCIVRSLRTARNAPDINTAGVDRRPNYRGLSPIFRRRHGGSGHRVSSAWDHNTSRPSGPSRYPRALRRVDRGRVHLCRLRWPNC